MVNIKETIAEVEKLNPELARQIRKYVHDHSYGLVFEDNLPEAVRLYTKKAAVNDTVNIRPPRGKNETAENRKAWNVTAVNKDGMATIENGEDKREVAADDLVPIVSYRDIIYPGLREIDRIERGGKDDPYQVVINAENYHALELLSYCYAGKVDCIYIDPPYNTGAKDWKYNNDYVDATDQYRHSKWLAFMERRLRLARDLLNRKNSVLIVTIDEKEYLRLGLLLEQIFPEARIQMISSVVNPSGVSRDNQFYRTDEYIFIVEIGNAAPQALPLDSEWITAKSSGKDSLRWRPLRRQGSHDTRRVRPGLFYPIYVSKDWTHFISVGDSLKPGEPVTSAPAHDDAIAVWPLKPNGDEGCWQIGQGMFKDLLAEGYVKISDRHTLLYIARGEQQKIENGYFTITGKNADGSVVVDDGRNVPFVPGTQWRISSHSARENGSALLNSLFPDNRFSFPKSVYAVHDVLRFFVADKPDALIVDFFAGSGTTLHAVNLLNAEDGGHRRCVCVTNNEVSADEQASFIKKGLRPGDKEWEARGIARYVTWPRTKCTIQGVDVTGKPLKGDYGYPVESYKEFEGDVLNPDTGKKIRAKAYKKTKHPAYPELSHLRMSDGFKANAIFFDLTYESEWPIRLDHAFDAIAPILWMQAGCRGPIIRRVGKSYLTTDYYGVLFDYGQASKFVQAVRKHPNIKNAFVVTDDQRRYSNMCRRLPGIQVTRLYESFLTTFEIYGEGGRD